MISRERAEELAYGWIDAFNRHDLDAVMAHYTDDVQFTSPSVIELAREPTGTLHGKDALRASFEKAIAAYPELGFELVHVLTGIQSVTLVYRSLHRERLGAEVMQLDAQGRIAAVLVHYE
jgi:hypothetical protein